MLQMDFFSQMTIYSCSKTQVSDQKYPNTFKKKKKKITNFNKNAKIALKEKNMKILKACDIGRQQILNIIVM